jgi:hypothetical protein
MVIPADTIPINDKDNSIFEKLSRVKKYGDMIEKIIINNAKEMSKPIRSSDILVFVFLFFGAQSCDTVDI